MCERFVDTDIICTCVKSFWADRTLLPLHKGLLIGPLLLVRMDHTFSFVLFVRKRTIGGGSRARKQTRIKTQHTVGVRVICQRNVD